MATKWRTRGMILALGGGLLVFLFGPYLDVLWGPSAFSGFESPSLVDVLIGPVPELLQWGLVALGLGLAVVGGLLVGIPADPGERDHVPTDEEMDSWPNPGSEE